MRTININQLQAQISRVLKDVEGGETYEVMRYSRPIAIIVPKDKKADDADKCDKCASKLDKIMMLLSLRGDDVYAKSEDK
jgi:antitoxin (DNA-binding transcriptional repressor) of toxin-antitoxin stability system